MRQLPGGTVTFLFTDIEGSTRLLHDLGAEGYAEALAEHRRVLRAAFAAHDGVEVDTQGDAFFVAFPTAPGALAAAAEAQAALALPVRMGVHTGTPLVAEEGYVGPDVNRAARIAASGHGGQVLVSAATASLADGVTLRDLGEHRFKDLAAPERVYQLGEAEFEPLRSLYRANLPVPATPFLGREDDLAAVAGRLRDPEVTLLTLTGPGGTGKTRLALQAAAEVAEEFPDGITWIALAPFDDSVLVLSTVAQVRGVRQEQDRPLRDLLAVSLDGKRLLLILDNAEHLLPALAADVAWLRDLGGPRLLVTSRERLRLQGEHVVAVPSLTRPDALALFIARAAALDVSVPRGAALDTLCGRLDDLPLAIELAAARTVLFAPEQLLERLGQRLDLLKGGRDADPRQQTLRATIEWSHDLLDDEERTLFRRFSVFAGGCDYEAVEAVCAGDAEVLQSLLDKSLLRRREDRAGVRYWMLETIREFASERLAESGEADEVDRRHEPPERSDTPTDLKARHARWYAALAHRSRDEWMQADAAGWFDRFEADIDNVRSAINWGLANDRELALSMLADTWFFWPQTGRTAEAKNLIDAAWADEVPVDLRKRALRARSAIALGQNDVRTLAEISTERIRLARETDDKVQEAGATTMLALACHASGDVADARRYFAESLALFEESDDVEGATTVLGNIARLERDEGNYELARDCIERHLTMVRSIGSEIDVAWALKEAASTAVAQAKTSDAQELLLECFGILRRHHLPAIEGDLVAVIAHLAEALGDAREAAVLFGAMQEWAARDAFDVLPSTKWWWQLRDKLVSQLGEAEFVVLEQEGRSVGEADAVARGYAFLQRNA